VNQNEEKDFNNQKDKGRNKNLISITDEQMYSFENSEISQVKEFEC
jgi:hypothetical protein